LSAHGVLLGLDCSNWVHLFADH